MRIGEYPPEYDKVKHGPYDPARYYGKPDTPFGQVKLGELFSWFCRRNKNPVAGVNLISRAYWRWQHKYAFPVSSTGRIPLFQGVAMSSAIGFILAYNRQRRNKRYHYH